MIDLSKFRLPTMAEAALFSVLAWTAHAHWHLAAQLAAPLWLRPLLPIAIDAYVVSALRAVGKKRDLKWALILDGFAVAGSHAAGQLALTDNEKAVIAGGLGVILVLVLWRVHEIAPAKKPVVRVVAQPLPETGGAVVQTKSTRSVMTKPTAPNRAAAREILLGLDDLEQTSAAELARRHGGSDVFWSQRKKDLRVELEEMSK